NGAGPSRDGSGARQTPVQGAVHETATMSNIAKVEKAGACENASGLKRVDGGASRSPESDQNSVRIGSSPPSDFHHRRISRRAACRASAQGRCVGTADIRTQQRTIPCRYGYARLHAALSQ